MRTFNIKRFGHLMTWTLYGQKSELLTTFVSMAAADHLREHGRHVFHSHGHRHLEPKRQSRLGAAGFL